MTDGLTPELLLQAYAAGIFPMSEGRDDPDLFWVDPRRRGVIPLDGFHISKSLRRAILRDDYEILADTAFGAVLDGCANRPETWINAEIRDMYLALFASGHAHSLEIWVDGELSGGLYGVTLGRAFFGESMFSSRRDASKIVLAWLVDRLRLAGFTLFDTQFLTPHLRSLGAVEITRADYRQRLEEALQAEADFSAVTGQTAQGVVQRNSQTS